MARAKKRKREVIEAPPETPIEEEVPLEPTPPATPPSKKNSARPSLTRTRGADIPAGHVTVTDER